MCNVGEKGESGSPGLRGRDGQPGRPGTTGPPGAKVQEFHVIAMFQTVSKNSMLAVQKFPVLVSLSTQTRRVALCCIVDLFAVKGKGSPYSITESRVPELILFAALQCLYSTRSPARSAAIASCKYAIKVDSYSYSYRVSLLNSCSQRNHAVL